MATTTSLSLEEKLFTVGRRTAKEAHIRLDPGLCAGCLGRVCLHVCPAQVYVWDEAEAKIHLRYENCLECGTCRVACEMGSIEWSNPSGGSGVIYKHS